MGHPVLLTVDDDPAVSAAIARDLRSGYGDRYRIVRADSGKAAVEAIEALILRGDVVALILADQRMPGMTGVELLAKARGLVPDAKRVLLTAYADTDAAIHAINEVRLDHYLMKPWDPPEENLYPVLNDLLEDWQANYRPPFEGVTVVGYRWSAPSHRVKDFLSRNLIPYRWLDVEDDDEARTLLDLAEVDAADLPLVRFPDGSHVANPTTVDLAERIGLRTRAELPSYDFVIVGGGPAGLAGAVYGASEGLSTLLVEGEAPGGQAGTSSRIENYLGFPSGLSGGDLSRRAVAQARRFGAEILTPLTATGITVQDPYRIVHLSDGSQVACRAMLVATGVAYRTLDAPGIDRLAGSGVYYGAAITEALSARDQDVFVVGGGNSAGQAAMYLARYARSVTLVVRGPSLTDSMSHYLIRQLDAEEAIHLAVNTRVTGAHGEDHLEALTLRDSESGTERVVGAAALFIFIGAAPKTDWLGDTVERDERGFLLSGIDLVRRGRPWRGWTLERDPFWLECSVPGVFTAGDVRHRSIKRVASAVGEGSMAVQFVHQHLGGG